MKHQTLAFLSLIAISNPVFSADLPQTEDRNNLPTQEVPPNTENFTDRLTAWLARMEKHAPASSPKQAPSIAALAALEEIRETVFNENGIRFFREHPRRDEAVKILVDFAASPLRAERLDATLSLANVVDNTTLCYPLSYLMTHPDIDPNGRVNLLQIVRGVSTYAFRDNEQWITQTLSAVRRSIASRSDMELTRQLIFEIETKLKTRNMGRTQDLASYNPVMYAKCVEQMKLAEAQ